MFADDETPQPLFDEKLDREGGALFAPDAREVSCDPDTEACAQDDYVGDPEARETGIPGTADDVPLDFGLESPPAADQHVVLEGATRVAGESAETKDQAEDQGATDEAELWSQQRALLEEDTDGGLKLAGFPEEAVPEILEAMGDDAADALPDFPSGTSATGEWTAPDHGGFPERKD
jgi:hypothetical protein